MKPAYLGTVRGYEPPSYRPGAGWSSGESGRRSSRRGAPVFAGRSGAYARPVLVSRRRWMRLRGKVTAVAIVITLAALVALVLRGVTHLL